MSKLLATFQERFARCTGATFATVITDLAPCCFSGCPASCLFKYPQES